MEEKIYLRRVKETDMKLLFDWRNNELVRKNSFVWTLLSGTSM